MQYHLSLWPAKYEWTGDILMQLPGDRIDLLDRHALLQQPSLMTRVVRKFYQLSRNPKIKAYENRVVWY
jgi:hypothetical protein